MRLNVLHFICPTGLHGAERWILALVRYLDRHKVRSVLAVTEESPLQDLSICDRFEQLGLRSVKFSMKGKYDPIILPKFVELVKREDIHVIHTHGYKSDLLGLLVARLTKRKIISTPHGFENWSDFKMKLFVKAGLLSLRGFDQVVPLSEDLQETLLSQGLKKKRITVIRNGVDTEEILSCSKDCQSNKSPDKVIGYVGRIDVHKNVKALLDTLEFYYQNVSMQVRLDLVGEGPMRSSLEEYARHLASKDKVRFCGYREDRLVIMKQFDLFCITSKREGIPRAVMEAMALGIPLVGFDVPGVNVLVKHNKTGLLAEFSQMEELAYCWQSILYNRDLANRLATNARHLLSKNFTATRMARDYEKLYAAVL